jgi:hypothetical protein
VLPLNFPSSSGTRATVVALTNHNCSGGQIEEELKMASGGAGDPTSSYAIGS